MSRPIPLTKPDGTVYAHVCGVCGTIGGGGVARLTDEGATAVTEDSSRDDAERCCVCRTCRAPSPYAIECADCRAKWRAKMEAEAAERAALATTSVAAEDAEQELTLVPAGHVVVKAGAVEEALVELPAHWEATRERLQHLLAWWRLAESFPAWVAAAAVQEEFAPRVTILDFRRSARGVQREGPSPGYMPSWTRGEYGVELVSPVREHIDAARARLREVR